MRMNQKTEALAAELEKIAKLLRAGQWEAVEVSLRLELDPIVMSAQPIGSPVSGIDYERSYFIEVEIREKRKDV